MDLKRDNDKAVSVVVENLKSQSQEVGDSIEDTTVGHICQ